MCVCVCPCQTEHRQHRSTHRLVVADMKQLLVTTALLFVLFQWQVLVSPAADGIIPGDRSIDQLISPCIRCRNRGQLMCVCVCVQRDLCTVTGERSHSGFNVAFWSLFRATTAGTHDLLQGQTVSHNWDSLTHTHTPHTHAQQYRKF